MEKYITDSRVLIEKLRNEILALSEMNEDAEKQLIELENRVKNHSITLDDAIKYGQQSYAYIKKNLQLIEIMKNQIKEMYDSGKN